MKFWICLLLLGISAVSVAETDVSDVSSARVQQRQMQLYQQATTAASRTTNTLSSLQKEVESSFGILSNGRSTVQELQSVTNAPVQNAYNQVQKAKAGVLPISGALSVAEISKMTGIQEEELQPFMASHNVLSNGTVVDVDDATKVLGKLDFDTKIFTTNEGQKTDIQNVSDAKTVMTQNALQNSVMVSEVLEGSKTQGISKEVALAASLFQKSQGAQTAAASMEKGRFSDGKTVSADTISGASDAMGKLLKMSRIDSALLERLVEYHDEKVEMTMDIEKQRKQDLQLLQTAWSVAATNIGAGSNAISNQFFDRVEPFIQAMKKACGSLGGVSAINDTERLVLFELTRSASLAALQLGLGSSVILNQVEGR